VTRSSYEFIFIIENIDPKSTDVCTIKVRVYQSSNINTELASPQKVLNR
jgi:hypothetical protein